MGGGGKGGKSPSAPDPAATAAAQTQQNKETALWNAVLNNVNQVTPYGNLTYKQTGGGKQYDMKAYDAAMKKYNAQSKTQPKPNPLGTWHNGYLVPGSTSTKSLKAPNKEDYMTGDLPPSFTSTINLSPDQQKILDSQERRDISMGQLGEEQIGRIRQSVSNPYSYAGLGSANDYATAAENALYSRLNPQFERDEEALRSRLINQGIGQGSDAYKREMDTFNQMKTDARNQAVLAGQQYGLTGRNQEIKEYDAQRNAPLNEYIGLTSGTQVTNPQFSGQGNGGAANTDYAGLVNQNYQNQIGQYNAQQANANNTQSSLFGLGGSLLGSAGAAGGFGKLFSGLFASDINLKENIEPVGVENGHNIYSFNYIGEPDRFVGVMAQEVLNTHPEAVLIGEDGYYRVNYDAIGVEFRRVQ